MHPSVPVQPSDSVLHAGLSSSGLCYSAFRDADKRTETGLLQLLQANKITSVYFAGVGFDHIVKVRVRVVLFVLFTRGPRRPPALCPCRTQHWMQQCFCTT